MVLRSFIIRSFEAFKNLLSPPFCAFCGAFLEERVHVCASCKRGIIPPVTCTMAVGSFDVKVFALSAYEGVVRKLVLAKNYGSPIASRQLGELMAREDFCPWHDYDYIIPIPLHWSRYAWRGFNQAHVIASPISRKSGVPIISAVKRRDKTVQQTKLSHAQRQENVREVFFLRPVYVEQLKGKRLLIIDDVMTSGATIKFVARTLAKAKPASISAVVGARVI